MKVLNTISEFRRERTKVTGSLALVPTMGHLHEGHMALVRKAREESNAVAVTIFVNPTQFGPSEDFQTYPRDMPRDLDLLNGQGVDLAFTPTPDEMYPPAFDTWVEVGALINGLEGSSRPGHFKGVTTVVLKLFNIVQPNRVYFGQKDAQQLLVIKKMIEDINLDVDLIAVPTVREHDGLAMSSRNSYLTLQERKAAPVLWRALSKAREMWAKGERSAEEIRKAMSCVISSEPLTKLDYVSVADLDSLEELSTIDQGALTSLAVWMGKTRLIDNVVLS